VFFALSFTIVEDFFCVSSNLFLNHHLKLSPLSRFFLFFTFTLVTTTLAGAEWMTGNFWFHFGQNMKPLGMGDFLRGLQFSIPFLGVLTVHEFGHYYFARKHKADVTLPLYIPAWLGFIAVQSLGTMGAFIRLKSQLKSRLEYFDVGVAGPLAGFVAALVLLFYGFTHLPPLDYLFHIHPDYAKYGADYAQHVYQNPGANLRIGSNLLFQFFETYVVSDKSLIPHSYELMHYPFIFAGYLSLFFTALNLMPIGQLDGGHILFSTFGSRVHSVVSPSLFVLFILYAGLGTPYPIDVHYDPFLPEKLWNNLMIFGVVFISVSRVFKYYLNNITLAVAIFGFQYVMRIWFPMVDGNSGWIVFGLILGRFLGIYHPEVEDNRPLDTKRLVISFLALVVFVICFSAKPFS
jgi:membrane-associated protease RseP (regulator of RpoE activity)